jgi:hypothetical protein
VSGVFRVTPMLPQYVGEDRRPHWQSGEPVRYVSQDGRAAFQLHFRDGLIYDSEGRLFDTADAASLHTGEGRAIFVMNQDGMFYAAKEHEAGKFHHSSLAAGEPVAAAGEMAVLNGRLVTISDASGHYRPARAFTEQALDQLARNGIDLNYVIKEFRHDP